MLFPKYPKRDYLASHRPYKPWFNKREPTIQPRNHWLLFIVSVLCFLLGVIASPLSHAESGELLMKNKEGETSSALLHKTHVDLQVNGMIAHVTYTQTFSNNSDEWQNAVYTFPLSEDAAINHMEMMIGERVIRGAIKPKQEAKNLYEIAKKAGKKASLTAQQRPNLFTQRVANIAPKEQIKVTLQFIQQVGYENGEFSFHLPTTLTPRYIPGIPISDLHNTALKQRALAGSASERKATTDAPISGWGVPTDEVTDADKITPLMTQARESLHAHQLSLNATLNTGMPVASITSAGHPVHWQAKTTEDHTYSVAFKDGAVTMDRDLWLRWQPETAAVPTAAYFKEKVGADHYALVMLTPPQVNPDDLQDFPRDVTFIIDTSGSMGGRPIEDAKSALAMAIKNLDTKDRFNVIAFNSKYTKLFSQPMNTKPHNISTALSFISGLSADGGTEMANALDEALKSKPQKNHIKQIVFITDGAIGNETALFALIKAKLGEARLFTVGIGSAPNSYFMTRAAKFGRGSYVFIDSSNSIQKEMQRLLTKLETPVLSNLTLALPENIEKRGDIEIYPKRLPDLYAGEPLLINIKIPNLYPSTTESTDKVSPAALNNAVLTGTLTDKNGEIHQWQRSIQDSGDIGEAAQQYGIATSWARKKIAALMDEKALGRKEEEVKHDILQVAIPHKLLSDYTSFVAVEEASSKPQNAASSSQAIKNILPHGMQLRTVSYPQTSTGKNLYLAIGALAIVLLLMLNAKHLFFFVLSTLKGTGIHG